MSIAPVTQLFTDRRTAPARTSAVGQDDQPVVPAATITLHLTIHIDKPHDVDMVRSLTERLIGSGEVTMLEPARTAAAPPAAAPPAAAPPAQTAPPVPDIGPDTVALDVGARTIWLAGAELPLCRLEFDLLLFLARHPRQVFTRGQLRTAVWGDEFGCARTVDVHIARLRRKLPGLQSMITTVRGIGYRLATHAPIVVIPEP